MKSLFIALLLTLSVNAFADGFKCEQLIHTLKIKVYNNTQPTEGTRNPAVMVLSDSSVAFGKKRSLLSLPLKEPWDKMVQAILLSWIFV
jgi:hypothetical protein